MMHFVSLKAEPGYAQKLLMLAGLEYTGTFSGNGGTCRGVLPASPHAQSTF